MWSLEKSAAVLVLVGLIFIGIGAFVTAQAVIITDDQAKQLGTTMWGSNPGLIESFKEQSRAARNGLYLIVGGIPSMSGKPASTIVGLVRSLVVPGPT